MQFIEMAAITGAMTHEKELQNMIPTRRVPVELFYHVPRTTQRGRVDTVCSTRRVVCNRGQMMGVIDV